MKHTYDLFSLPSLSNKTRALAFKHMDANTAAQLLKDAIFRKKLELGFFILIGFAFALYSMMYMEFPAGSAAKSTFAEYLIRLTSTLMFAVFLYMSYTVGTDDETVRLLRPIAGTDACTAAARMVTSPVPGTLEWRDQAILERGQLHFFDVAVMWQLEVQHKETNGGCGWDLKRAEDCRIAHGLAI